MRGLVAPFVDLSALLRRRLRARLYGDQEPGIIGWAAIFLLHLILFGIVLTVTATVAGFAAWAGYLIY